jgi:hypothetical protein
MRPVVEDTHKTNYCLNGFRESTVSSRGHEIP